VVSTTHRTFRCSCSSKLYYGNPVDGSTCILTSFFLPQKWSSRHRGIIPVLFLGHLNSLITPICPFPRTSISFPGFGTLQVRRSTLFHYSFGKCLRYSPFPPFSDWLPLSPSAIAYHLPENDALYSASVMSLRDLPTRLLVNPEPFFTKFSRLRFL